MLVSKKVLELTTHAATESYRYSTNGILIEPDGTTVATDGSRLAVYKPETATDDEYPRIEGLGEPTGEALEPFILPIDAAKEILRAIPKPRKSPLPILSENFQIDVPSTNANGNAAIGVTDLENPRVFRPAKVEGTFPNYRGVLPKDEPKAKVAIDAKYLKQAADLLTRLSDAKSGVPVVLEFFGEDKPIRLTTPGVDGLIIVMPMHV